MKATLYKPTGQYQIIIPPSITGTGKRQRKFFTEKKDADAKIREIKVHGVDATKNLGSDDIALFQLIKKEYEGSALKAFEALSQHSRMMEKVKKPGATIHEAAVAFQADQEDKGRHRVTRSKYRSTLNRFCAMAGRQLPIVEVTEEMITEDFLKFFKTTGTRKSQWSNLHAFFKWAIKKGYVSTHPLANAERLGKWKSKKGFLAVEDFRRILFACVDRFPRLLPYFVLGGLAGLRRCELISSQSLDQDPRIEWTDIDFKQNKIRIRHEVAKETDADDRRRTIPLEPAAKQWLQLVSEREGPVLAISQSTLQREKAVLLDELGIKVPENALRNSYASYGASFRSLGDVARALGDTEVTAKRYYVDVGIDDPEVGRAWFDIRPNASPKIISIAV